MNDLNSVFIVGRVAAEPQVKSVKSGLKILVLRIANHHYSFDEEKKEYAEETGFFNVVMFGRQAEKWGGLSCEPVKPQLLAIKHQEPIPSLVPSVS